MSRAIAVFRGDGLPIWFFSIYSTTCDGGSVPCKRIVLRAPTAQHQTVHFLRASLAGPIRAWYANRVAHWMDINGDGLDDFVFAQSLGTSPAINRWTVRLNQGGTLSASINTGSSAGLKTLSSGGSAFRYANRLPQMDVDGDGRVDLLAPRAIATVPSGLERARV